jgi:hypothetical protein
VVSAQEYAGGSSSVLGLFLGFDTWCRRLGCIAGQTDDEDEKTVFIFYLLLILEQQVNNNPTTRHKHCRKQRTKNFDL